MELLYLYLYLHIKYPVFLSYFKGTSPFSTDITKSFKYQSVPWKPSCSKQTDRRKKLTGAFRNSASAPKNKFKSLAIYQSIWRNKPGDADLLHSRSKNLGSRNKQHSFLPQKQFNPLNPELNPICYLLALLGAHHFLHVSRIRVKILTFRLLMSYIYGAPILDVSRSHTTTQHSR